MFNLKQRWILNRYFLSKDFIDMDDRMKQNEQDARNVFGSHVIKYCSYRRSHSSRQKVIPRRIEVRDVGGNLPNWYDLQGFDERGIGTITVTMTQLFCGRSYCVLSILSLAITSFTNYLKILLITCLDCYFSFYQFNVMILSFW